LTSDSIIHTENSVFIGYDALAQIRKL
jgi:hypothetical protein